MSPAAPDRRSKHEQIAADLYAAIEAGEYAPGARLPSESDLVTAHGASRDTVRKALALLVNWGVAEARKGSGVFVRDFRPVVRNAVERLSSSSWPAGRSMWDDETAGRNRGVDQIEISETAAPPRVREMLGLAEGVPVILRSRRYTVDGKPVLLARSWLPADIARGTAMAQEDTGPGGIYARLRDIGRRPVRFREDVRARMLPDPDERAARLELAPGTPVVEIARTAYDADGTPLEVNEMTADASAYLFRYDIDSI